MRWDGQIWARHLEIIYDFISEARGIMEGFGENLFFQTPFVIIINISHIIV